MPKLLIRAMAHKVNRLQINLIVTLFACVSCSAFATPCAKMIQPISEEKKAIFAKAINVHLNQQLGPSLNQTLFTDGADILEVIHFKKWYIIYVNTHITDEIFLVYRSAPNKSYGYLTSWAGSATNDEGSRIENWLKKEALGIPKKLASCFAWHITEGRNQ
ncbi:hypothetical protein ACFQNF_18000 [Iodobacter arcticus]|uniref:Lipoprotein n=1 Tax=Iodobacter arcticus TaxID=590593 RepID=A0ABW2R6A1_9NEIS